MKISKLKKSHQINEEFLDEPFDDSWQRNDARIRLVIVRGSNFAVIDIHIDFILRIEISGFTPLPCRVTKTKMLTHPK